MKSTQSDKRYDILEAIGQIARDKNVTREEVVETIVQDGIPEGAYHEQWDLDGLHTRTIATFGLDLPVKEWAGEEGIADQEIYDRILKASDEKMAERASHFGPEMMRMAEKKKLDAHRHNNREKTTSLKRSNHTWR